VTPSWRPARTWLTVGRPGEAPAVVSWPASDPDGDAVPLPGGRLAVTGELVTADTAADDTGRLEIADVICCGGAAGASKPLAWLRRTLDRYPGCAVVVIMPGQHEVAIAVRARRPFAFQVVADLDAGDIALASASFAYGWLTAGWAIEWLRPATLRVAGCLFPDRSRAVRAAAAPLSFGMFYDVGSPGSVLVADPSSASRRRTSSASGASTPE
jgi:hypothetical protein